MGYVDVDKAVRHAKLGDPVIILDDLREMEGDLFCPIQTLSIEVVEYMLRRCSGLYCAVLPRDRLDEMGIPRITALVSALRYLASGRYDEVGLGVRRYLAYMDMMEMERSSSPPVEDTPFHLPVDARECRSGISAHERLITTRRLIDPEADMRAFAIPGHVVTLGAHRHGLKGRIGHTEAAYELTRLAGLVPGAVLCEILADGGHTAQEELWEISEREGIPILKLSDLVAAVDGVGRRMLV